MNRYLPWLTVLLLSPLASFARAAATKPVPVVDQWNGFTMTLGPGYSDAPTSSKPDANATAPNPVVVYFNDGIKGAPGTVLLAIGTNPPAQFSYDASFPLFFLTRLPDKDKDGKVVYERKLSSMTLYVQNTDKTTVRAVVRDNGPDHASPLLDTTKDKLDIKPLDEPSAFVVRDPIKHEASKLAQAPPASEDDLAADLATVCASQCKKSELFFFQSALHDADAMPDSSPDKKRLLALKTLVIKDAAGASKSMDDPVALNRLRSDAYIQQQMAGQVAKPNQAVTDKMLAARVTQDDLLADFCPTLGPKMGALGNSSAFSQLKQQAQGADQWDGQSASGAQQACNDYFARTGKTDPRLSHVNDNTSAGPVKGDLVGNGVYTVPTTDSAPPPAKTNPYKSYIFGGKMGFVTGLLGFIFAGPAGAVLFGLMGAAAGYYISSYK